MADFARPAVRVQRQNWLLAALGRQERQALEVTLEPVRLQLRQRLYERNQPIDYVYFPETAVCSLITVMSDGEAAESGTIGFDGVVGVDVALGSRLAPCETIVQVPGAAQRMAATAFLAQLSRSAELRDVVHRHVHALLVQSLQSTACNRLHSLMERCCRWLLLTHDRVACDEFRLTHDILAVMVGVRRPSVTLTLGELESCGIIALGRGRLRVRDRSGLEARACECYATTRDHLLRIGATAGVG